MDPAALQESVAFLKQATNNATPRVGVICGSGLSGLVSCLNEEGKTVVQYGDIPHFPQTTIAGHKGELVFGAVEKTSVVLMRGRFHSYEGHDMKTVTLPVRLMRALGVEILIVTNAAGGVNRSFAVGDLMVITDHIGFPMLAGKHPLVGHNDDSFGGARFTPMSDAYDPVLRQLVIDTGAEQGLNSFLRGEGCYGFVSGPTYETCAESLMLLRMGVDAVGMSTVPEATQARHCGMRVLGLSLITNSVRLPGDEGPAASHEEVLETVDLRSKQIEGLVRTVIAKLDADTLAALEPELAKKAAAAPPAGPGGDLRSRLLGLDIGNMTPLQALNELQALQQLARKA